MECASTAMLIYGLPAPVFWQLACARMSTLAMKDLVCAMGADCNLSHVLRHLEGQVVPANQ